MGEVATLNLKPTIIGLFRSRQLIPPRPLELPLGWTIHGQDVDVVNDDDDNDRSGCMLVVNLHRVDIYAL